MYPEAIYQIGDIVYHNSPDGIRGVVLDICYYYKSKSIRYLISWDHTTVDWYGDLELSDTKVLDI